MTETFSISTLHHGASYQTFPPISGVSRLSKLPFPHVDLGTTIMAVEFDGGVVFGADSRTSAGSFIVNRVTDKLTKITDNIYCCRSGSAADTQAIANIVKMNLEMHEIELNTPPQVSDAAAVFKQYCYGYRDQLMAGIIVAGYRGF